MTFAVLLTSSGYLLEHGLEQSQLYNFLQRKIHSKIQLYMIDVKARRGVDILQDFVRQFFQSFIKFKVA